MSISKIHNVPRDQIRMKSGQILTVDPIKPITIDNAPAETREFNERMGRVLGNSKRPFIIVRVYDTIDSVFATTTTLIFTDEIETIRFLTVQIEAAKDTRFPAL